MSIVGTILTACSTIVAGISGLDSDHVKIRKRLVYVKEYDPTPPLVIICPKPEENIDYDMNSTVHMDVRIVVALLQESSLLYESLEYVLLKREQIREKLTKPTLSSSAGVYDIRAYDPSPQFDTGGLDQHFDISLQEFTYRVSATRSS